MDAKRNAKLAHRIFNLVFETNTFPLGNLHGRVRNSVGGVIWSVTYVLVLVVGTLLVALVWGWLVRHGARLAAVGVDVVEPEAPASVDQLGDLLDDVEVEQVVPG